MLFLVYCGIRPSLESGLPEMKISDPSFKFVISNSRRFKYIVKLDLVWTYTGLINFMS